MVPSYLELASAPSQTSPSFARSSNADRLLSVKSATGGIQLASWHFNVEDPWVRKDPIEDEFFSAEGHADALVRESIQNSLDAGTGAGPVTVRFLISRTHKLPAASTGRLLSGLREHLDAPEHRELLHGFEWTKEERMDFLVVEDFGTRGLVGNPRALKVTTADKSPNDFYYFFRNVGRSGKSDTDRGRWGLGKTVFPAASRIRSFFGLTVRADEPRSLLMGQAVLKTHEWNGRQFGAYGFFAEIESDHPFPSQDDEEIDRFKTLFNLRRRDDPGLSVVVPYPLAALDKQRMVQSVIEHYFLPILSGDLQVEVEDERGTTIIQRDTIETIAKEKPATTGRKKKAPPPFDLARWYLQKRVSNTIPLGSPKEGRAPVWDDPQILGGVDLKNLRSRFANRERLCFRVAVPVTLKNQRPVRSTFDVVIERDESLTRPDEHYIRGGMAISGIRAVKETGVRGLVVVDDKPISKLMGDAENPAHTEWPERGTRVGQRYEYGPSCVTFVKKSLNELAIILSMPAEEVEKNLLRDIFYVENPPPPAVDRIRGTESRGSESPEDELDLDPPALKPFEVTRIEGGFHVTQGKRPEPVRRIRIQAAYDVRSGNPFSAWRTFDFDFAQPRNSPEVQCVGAEVVLRDGNALELEIRTTEFDIRVTGFDPNRDLRVKVRELDVAPAEVSS